MWTWLIVLCGVLALIGIVARRRLANTEPAIKNLPQDTGEPEDSPAGTKSESPTEREAGAVTATKDGGWVINPGSAFRLTLYGIDQATAVHIKHLLDEKGPEWPTPAKVDALFPLIVRSNLRCKEIDAYISEFRPVYLKALDDLQRTSPEWAAATGPGRKDLLASFRAHALASLDVRPRGNLVTLFEDTPSDMTIDDALLDRFGYDAVRLYLRHAEPPGKIHCISRKHPDRAGFEKLVDLGLALHGTEIALPAIVETLKLKDIKAMVADLNSPSLTRKSQAVPYLLALPDAKERVAQAVPFEEFFQLCPLPAEFTHLDLQRVASTWRYVRELATLIVETYTRGDDAVDQKQLWQESDAAVSGWKIIADEQACPYCKRAAERTYPPGQAPRVPLHLGCHCQLSPHHAPPAEPAYEPHSVEAV
ncbi:MAG: hypothetical protein AB1671_06255 [Thermodesulfobacteriota bacterium]|jgi:hypothetical protein